MIERQALFFTQPHTIAVRREPLPELEPEQVLVRTLVSAVSAGTEMLVYRNQLPRGMSVDATIAALDGAFAYPLKYGYAAVGEITACGAAVDSTWKGRRVFAFQPHQSHFVAAIDELLPVPEDVPSEAAALLPNMETAVSFVMDAQPVIGERVAVFGQGMVGLLTTGLLAGMPLSRLVVVDAFARRRRWARRLGADLALDAILPDLNDQILRGLDDGDDYQGADLCFELSGNPAALEAAIAVAGYDGRVLVGSWYGEKPAELHLGRSFHRGQVRLISSQVSHISPRWRGRFSKSRRLALAWRMLARLRPQRLITHRYPLSAAGEAYALLDRQPEAVLQLLFVYDEE